METRGSAAREKENWGTEDGRRAEEELRREKGGGQEQSRSEWRNSWSRGGDFIYLRIHKGARREQWFIAKKLEIVARP